MAIACLALCWTLVPSRMSQAMFRQNDDFVVLNYREPELRNVTKEIWRIKKRNRTPDVLDVSLDIEGASDIRLIDQNTMAPYYPLAGI